MKYSESESRERIVAYLATLRTQLAINPKASTSAISRLSGISSAMAGTLRELGVISEIAGDGGHKWESLQTDGEIADLIILHRRKQSGHAPVADTVALQRELERLAAACAALEKRIADHLSGHPTGKAQLEADDRELLRLAINDDENQTARIKQLEETVAKLMFKVESLRPVPELVAEPRAKPVRKVAVIGMHPRDHRHIHDQVALALGQRAREVELCFIDHTTPLALDGGGIAAYVVTADADHRCAELKRKGLGPITRTTSGVKSVAAAITDYARAA